MDPFGDVRGELKDFALERARRAEDNREWTPAQMLRITADDLDSGEVTATAAIVVLLDAGDDDDEYGTVARISHLKPSQVVSLLEVVKLKMMTILALGDPDGS